MVPTAETRVRLREMIGEQIPAGGTEANTRFTTQEIDRLLDGYETLNGAAAEGWTRKASRAFDMRGGLENARVGAESFTFVSLKDYRSHCLEMAKYYRDLILEEEGYVGTTGVLLGYSLPDVLGTGEGYDDDYDISR